MTTPHRPSVHTTAGANPSTRLSGEPPGRDDEGTASASVVGPPAAAQTQGAWAIRKPSNSAAHHGAEAPAGLADR